MTEIVLFHHAGGLTDGVVAFAQSVGEETFAARVTDVVWSLPTDLVYGAGVPVQAHVTEGDEWRELDAEKEYVAEIPGAELFVYPGSGHLFAEPGHPDFDEEVARLATGRVLDFLSAL